MYMGAIYNSMVTSSGGFDTARLTRVSVGGAVVGWIGTIALGAGLQSAVSLDFVVLGISLFWLALTAGVVAYVAPTTPPSLSRNVVWRYWLVASVIGILINVLAALLVTTGVASGEPIEETAPMEFGVVLPWLVIYAGGYLLPAVYKRDRRGLNRLERRIYGIAGIVSLGLAAALAVVPAAYPAMVLALAVLSLVPLLTLRYRGRS